MGTSDRRPYETATVLDQPFLDEAHDNLTNKLELDVQIFTPAANPNIFASDINKYTGGQFYEALLNFPVIRRTVGEFLDTTLEFEDLELELNNVDARFNEFLPSGANFDGWIARRVIVRLGLSEIESTYKTIFEGFLTEEGGFNRDTMSLKLRYRNRFDVLNKTFPDTVLTEAVYPNIEDGNKNILVPYILGDWTTNLEPGGASIPAFIVNGALATVNGDTSKVTPIELVICENVLRAFDTSQVYVARGDVFHLMDAADIFDVGVDLNQFKIRQLTSAPAGVTQILTDDGSFVPFEFESGDEFFVKVLGKDIGFSFNDNAVEQARDLLKTYAGLVLADFDPNWDVFRVKAAPPESAVFDIKSRVWSQEPTSVLQYALSLMEQVRLEFFISRDNDIKISSLHLDDFVASPTFEIKEWDIQEDTFTPKLDERNNFNRAKAVLNFLPNRDEELSESRFFRNSPAISQAEDKEITKQVAYPNLYILTDVENQLTETLRISSAYLENINVTLTWRSMLLDIGDFVKLNVDIDGTVFEDVPALIREIGYDPDGIKIPVRLWSFQMLPFPGYVPGYSGTVGGSTGIITVET